MASASAASLSGVEVPWALIWRDVRGVEAGVVERQLACRRWRPAPPGDGAVMWWASAVLAGAEHLGEDRGAAGDGVLPLLEHQHGGALGHDEAVAVDVERTRDSPSCDIAVMLVNPAIAGPVHGRLGAAGDHGVAAAVGDQAGGVAERRGCRRRTPCRSSRTGPGSRSASRRRRRGVGHHHRHEERARPDGRPWSMRTTTCSSRVSEAADRRCRRSSPKRAGSAPMSPAWSKRLGRGRDGELREAVGPAGLLRVGEPGRRVAVGDRTERVGWRLGADPGAEQAVPEGLLADAAGRDDTEAGDGDPATAPVHQPEILAATRSKRLTDRLDALELRLVRR